MKKTFKFRSRDGITDIYCAKWEVKKPKAILQVAHGMSEFIDRYEEFAKFFNDRGILVVGNDHIGHGYSIADDRAPMYFGEKGSWGCVVDDIFTLYKMTKEEYPDVPYFVFGLSLGSYLMRALLINYSEGVDGAILVGTGQTSPLELKLGLFVAERERKKYGDDVPTDQINDLTYGTYNKKFKPNRTEMDWLCSNEDALDAFIADKRRGKAFTVGLFRELLTVMLYSREMNHIKQMRKELPVLFLSGEEDPVGEFTKGVKNAYNDFKKAGLEDVTLKLYPALRHDILNEKNREEVFADTYSWIERVMGNNE